ncbi:11879_t:CDS:2 [Funneliformis geosporum]|uniref:14542_t:CDS:1 n=1 Tax=Funneliformis geosporum TaxID=1117311 RepID=A0A9W4X1Q1_9GLOM|nr:11879_t:CDS:2 [Funneliformis geosporum]CAI2179970.1 14542_t:CDS:2 [Funneliformis geosporum]
MTEESLDTTNVSNNNENEQKNPPKKTRSASDAERRRARRERKILGDAGSRLHRITATHNPSLNTVGEVSSTLTSPLTSRRSSPQPSQKSSPTTTEAPDNPFSPKRKNTGNNEASSPTKVPPSDAGSSNITSEKTFPSIRVSSYADPPDCFGTMPQNFSQEDNYPVHPTTPTKLPSGIPSVPSTPLTPLTTALPSTASMLGEDEPNGNHGHFENQDEYIRQILGNFAAGNYQARNSSMTSLASTLGGGEYNPQQIGGFPGSYTAQDEFIQQDILQQQQLQQIPFPFQQFLNPDMKFFNPFGGASQQQLDLQSKLWQVIHFGTIILLGGLLASVEFLREKGAWTRFYRLNYERPEDIIATESIPYMRVFWYFITVELILQSSRMFFQQDRVFQGSTLGQFASKLPAPFSDVLTVLLRYNLIWNSLLEDICILVFIVGFTITMAPFISYFA